MSKFVIVKLGSTIPSLVSRKGDFDDWILLGMGVASEETSVVDVPNGQPFPLQAEIQGVVVTGSHSMLTDHHDWSERTAAWLSAGVEKRIPTLGICYGHQLLAYALGGQVGNNPNGREFGTVEVHLNEDAAGDALLGGFPSTMKAHVSHTQSVLRLPSQAKRLAYSERDPNQAFVVNNCAWGVQFHPEFDAEIVREYTLGHSDVLIAEGQNPVELAAASVDTPHGTEILKRFVAMARGQVRA
jgi:GMP synthase (glutamine-hydrolysing)